LKTFLEFLNESTLVTAYHGGPTKLKNIDPKFMNIGNTEYGIGIYFATDEETTKTYGPAVSTITIDPAKFIDSFSPAGKLGTKLTKLLIALWPHNKEAMFYMVSDYIEVSEEEDVTEDHIKQLAKHLKDSQIRHLQVDLVRAFGEDAFVDEWMKNVKLDGTFYKNSSTDTWYAVINTKLPLS
jgi:hypothetical protein